MSKQKLKQFGAFYIATILTLFILDYAVHPVGAAGLAFMPAIISILAVIAFNAGTIKQKE